MRFLHAYRTLALAAALPLAVPLAASGSGWGDTPCPPTGKEAAPAEGVAVEAQPKGYSNLLPNGSLALWQGRFISPFVETRMPRLRRHRFQRLADLDMAVHWKVRGGVLFYDGDGKNIRTIRQYRNLEMYLDWKVSQGGTGAVYLRSMPAIRFWDTSLENLGAGVGSGGLYWNRTHPSKPAVRADRPVGEWNRFHIKMVGNRVTVRLNDQLVVDDEVLENNWTPGGPLLPSGHIELEGKDSPLRFANIYVRPLP